MELSTKKVTKRVAGYVRVSTMEQAAEGYSLAAQRQQIQEYCDKEEGRQLVNVYADEGISGKSISKRPAIQELLQDAKQHKFDVVVVWKNSRLARNTRELLEMLDIFDKNGVNFVSLSEGISRDTPVGRFAFTLLGTVSELERDNIAENVYLGERKRAQEGYANVGRVIGYEPGVDEFGKRSLVINPDEAPIIIRIFNMYADGHGYQYIARQLNDMGYKTKAGNDFSVTAVKTIVDNPLYVGKVRYGMYRNWDKKGRRGKNTENMILVDGKHEAIISDELWKRVVDRRKMVEKMPKWNYNGKNILTGILRCPECGGSMVMTSTTNKDRNGKAKKLRYYSCAKAKHSGKTACNYNSISAEKAERIVEEKLSYVLLQPNIAEKVVDRMNDDMDKRVNEYQKSISNKEVEIERINQKINRYVAIDDDPELLRQINSRKALLQQKVNELENDISTFRKRIVAVENRTDVATINDILRWVYQITRSKNRNYLKQIYATFIETVTIDKEHKLLNVHMRFSDSVINQISKFQQEKAGVPSVGAPAFHLDKEILFTI
ncbi:recombinase family protein [Lentilactobacillus senioris]|uniref:recombinase family protein n=1 Tax=Lentilactobacillus senioris TaxID=931534 RepID=UPI0022808894|nr:recombinase family protein [Lentilactobacillus senioris]MCY9806090.1 recombinase family protein [Lentilactobacillus senioris]